MFDSDDEENYTEMSSSQPMEAYPPPPPPQQRQPAAAPAPRYNPPPQSEPSRAAWTTAVKRQPQPSFNNNVTRRSPSFIGDEVDPFYDYPGAIVYNGFIVTAEIPQRVSREFSFYVFCQENQVIYGIPRRLTTPPPRLKLNHEQRWRKQWDLEFGRKVEFILDQHQRVLTYKKGSSDLVVAEVIDGRNCFRLNCVFDQELSKAFCIEFGQSVLTQPLMEYYPNLVYECLIVFDENRVFQQRTAFGIYKVLSVAADQSLTFASTWAENDPNFHGLADDVAELKDNENFKANVTGFRYSDLDVLHINSHETLPIMFGVNWENEAKIGALFQMDYVKHPLEKMYIVTATYRHETPLKYLEIQNKVYIFEIKLNVLMNQYGYFHHEKLGMIADPKGCLRFLPYAHNRDVDEIPVRVKVSRTAPAKFEVYELTEDGQRLARQSEPSIFESDGLLYNCKMGKLYSIQYPSLDLRIAESQRSKFEFGDFIVGKFKRANPFDETKNYYVSLNIRKSDNSSVRRKQINDTYGLMVIKAQKIKYQAPLSQKLIKKGHAYDFPTFPKYNYYFQNYWEASNGGLISGTNGRINSQAETLWMIVETNIKKNAQTVFNFVDKASPGGTMDDDTLNLDKNISLKNHVAKQLQIREENTETLVDFETDEPQITETIEHPLPQPEFPQVQRPPQSEVSTALRQSISPTLTDRAGQSNTSISMPSQQTIQHSERFLQNKAATQPSSSSSSSSTNHPPQRQSKKALVANSAQQLQKATERIGRMTIEVEPPRRSAAPQLGRPRFRNLFLYEPNYEIEKTVAEFLNKIERFLHNPPSSKPQISIKKSKNDNEKVLPEFEELVAYFL